jgi:hypothetical protein
MKSPILAIRQRARHCPAEFVAGRRAVGSNNFAIAADRFARTGHARVNSGDRIPGTPYLSLNSRDTLLIFDLWARLFGFELSIQQPFQSFNEDIISHWPTGSLVFSEKCHIRFLDISG